MKKHKNKPWHWDIRCYMKNAGTIRPNKRVWSRLRRTYWINKWMSAKGCEECGFNDPRALELDHIDPSRKLFGVKGAGTPIEKAGSHQISMLMAEVRKCRVLCSNCHKIKTQNNGECGGHRSFTHEERMEAYKAYTNEEYK